MASIGTTGKPHATLSRVAALCLIVALVAFWYWAFLVYDAPGNPDRLEDRSWVTAANQRCSRMALAVGDLPAAADSPSPAHRADVLDEATDLLDQFVADLRDLPVGTADDQVLLAGWFDDWDIYIADRRFHARRLRTEGDVRPYLTALPSGAGSHVERMNGFARVNDMEGCLEPGDL
ncbi:MAG: hypothetical protein H8E59_09390 [Actinobacteria bacterium]|nr:hypothetical protein [Actinomycetota bacterium]